MRTTLDIDDALLARVQAQFPPGTPKTILVEEGLRSLIVSHPESVTAPRRRHDPRMQRLIKEGHVMAAISSAPLEPLDTSMDRIPLAQLLVDLDKDREDR